MSRITFIPQTPADRSTRQNILDAYIDLSKRHEGLVTEHNALQETIVSEAIDAAERNGWCAEVQRTLVSAGLGDFLPSNKRKVTVTFEVEVEDEDFEYGDDEACYEQDAIDRIRGGGFGYDQPEPVKITTEEVPN